MATLLSTTRGSIEADNVTRLDGNDFDNVLTGDDNNFIFRGDDGNDTIIGNGGDDDIGGRQGNDTIFREGLSRWR